MPLVETKIENFVGAICLDYFEKRNALCGTLVAEIIDALDSFVERRVRAVVLRARPGVKIWSAGHDVDELPEGRRDPLGWYDPLRRLVRAIENHPAPVIAMIEGGVWGGGCEAALACDIIVAAPNATFALTPAKLGVPYNVSGMLTFLNAAPLRLIKEMAFTAKPISAERALSAGLINHMIPLEDLESFTYAIASDIVGNAPLSIAVMKEELRILAGAHPMSPQGWERVQGLRRVVYDSADYVEGVKAFKEKRRPVYRGE
ncbi:MAG: methylmalonyl-CoA decarboxylase [Hyphomicrobiales bacterium]|nr:methylmalonyl-CoA decarboxylase [Hyphomicrobiales bacterium]